MTDLSSSTRSVKGPYIVTSAGKHEADAWRSCSSTGGWPRWLALLPSLPPEPHP
jgi:hypothetical protein